jgi:ribonuclease-3
MSKRDLTAFQARLGYRFGKEALLEQALTHSSHSGNNNERLEFLGDRVLNLVIAHALYEAFPREAEGALAKRHAGLVQAKMLVQIAQELSLGDILILSDAERATGGAMNENILSDAVEAVLGAIYLDAGYGPAQELVLRLWGARIHTINETHADPKTELQEFVQAKGWPLPDYEITGRSGPDHAPTFEITLTVRGQVPLTAMGPSRRAAEKEAAKAMLSVLKDKS